MQKFPTCQTGHTPVSEITTTDFRVTKCLRPLTYSSVLSPIKTNLLSHWESALEENRPKVHSGSISQELEGMNGLHCPVPWEVPDSLGWQPRRLQLLACLMLLVPRSPGSRRALARSTSHSSASWFSPTPFLWLIMPRGIPGSCVPEY